MDKAELEKRFAHHEPEGDQSKHYETIRTMAKSFALYLNGICPDGRAKSTALTKLDEAVMWANKSIAEDGENATE